MAADVRRLDLSADAELVLESPTILGAIAAAAAAADRVRKFRQKEEATKRRAQGLIAL